MSTSYEYGALHDQHEIDALGALEARSFGGTIEFGRHLVGAYCDHARALRAGGDLIAGLLLIPMGQFLGGKRVTMTGVAGVAVEPHLRGRGAATALMRAAVSELHQQGVAISTLYPATFPLYRRVGYEHAGGRYRITVPARHIPISDHELDMRPACNSDLPAIQAMYADQARLRQGWLDRGEYIWERVLGSPDDDVRMFLVLSGDTPEGYLIYSQKSDPTGGYHIHVRDMMAVSARAGRRILAFLAGTRSQARNVVWHGGPDDALVYLMPESGITMTFNYPWMVRIIDIISALSQRGYPPDLNCRLDLQIIDDVIVQNNDRYMLEVAGGAAAVRKGGRGTMKLDIRALASLYTGHMSPYQLAALGGIDASPRLLARAAVIFAGPPPSLPDFF